MPDIAHRGALVEYERLESTCYHLTRTSNGCDVKYEATYRADPDMNYMPEAVARNFGEEVQWTVQYSMLPEGAQSVATRDQDIAGTRILRQRVHGDDHGYGRQKAEIHTSAFGDACGTVYHKNGISQSVTRGSRPQNGGGVALLAALYADRPQFGSNQRWIEKPKQERHSVSLLYDLATRAGTRWVSPLQDYRDGMG